MRVVLFCHSIVSDWNHGNAHFLRGIATELVARGHEVRVYEPRGGWSRTSLEREHGTAPARAFHERFPHLAEVFRAGSGTWRWATDDDRYVSAA